MLYLIGKKTGIDGQVRRLSVTHIMVQNPTFEFFRQLHSHDPKSVAYLDHALQLIDNIDTNNLIKIYDTKGVEIYTLINK